MKKDNYIPRKGKIIERTPLTKDTVAFRIKLSGKEPFIFRPGQFVMLSALGFGEVPIGITVSPKEKDYIEVAVRSVGLVTKKLCSLKVGDEIGVRGPFGNGFPLGDIKGKDVVLISGGLGLAPLRSLIHHFGKTKNLCKSLTILSGCRGEDDLLYRDEYKKWEKFAKIHLAVENCSPEWTGTVGLITKIYDQANIKRGSVIISCGPPVMFKSVIDRFAGKRVAEKDMYFLLERRMKCGVGKCQHCTCGKYYVCLDGPVFSYEQLKYNEEAFK